MVAVGALAAAVWALLLAAVLHHHLTDDVAGMHAVISRDAVRGLLRRRGRGSSGEAGEDFGGARAGALANADANANATTSNTMPHGKRYKHRYRHTCTCLNETTLSGFANNPAHPLAAPLPYGFEWLHIPKTGSSFAATLWSFACTRRGRIDLSISNDVGGSQALPWSKSFLFHDLYGEPLPFELFLIVMCMCTCTGIYAYRYIYTGTHA